MANWINHGFTLDGGSGASDRSDANAILIDPLFKGAKNNNKKDIFLYFFSKYILHFCYSGVYCRLFSPLS